MRREKPNTGREESLRKSGRTVSDNLSTLNVELLKQELADEIILHAKPDAEPAGIALVYPRSFFISFCSRGTKLSLRLWPTTEHFSLRTCIKRQLKLTWS